MSDGIDKDRMVVQFAGAQAGTEPLTWGQKAFLQDMRESGNQFSMRGRVDLPEGSTIEDAAARVNGLFVRHAALRMRLGADLAGRPCQEVAGSGQFGLDILTFPEDADRTDVARYRDDLYINWPAERFDFHHDWPLRAAVLRHRGACLHLVFVLSHLAADGGGLLLLLADLLADETGRAKSPGTRTCSTLPGASRRRSFGSLAAARCGTGNRSSCISRRRPSAAPLGRLVRQGSATGRPGSVRLRPTWPCWPFPGAPAPMLPE